MPQTRKIAEVTKSKQRDVQLIYGRDITYNHSRGVAAGVKACCMVEGHTVVFKLCSELNIFVPMQLVCESAKWLPWSRLCTVGSAGNQDCVGPNGQKVLCFSANNVHEIFLC